jgi:hypothetical protein
VFSEQQALGSACSAAASGLAGDQGLTDGPPTVGDLAERLAIRHNSAVGLINRLVSAGYATRRDDPSDRRAQASL